MTPIQLRQLELVYIDKEITEKSTDIANKTAEVNAKRAELDNAVNIFKDQEALYDTRAQATGTNATAIGYKAVANGDNTIAFGEEANAGAENAIAFGKEANAGAENAIALGTGAAVTESGTRSISIGNKTGKVNGKNVTGNAVTGTDSISLGNGITFRDPGRQVWVCGKRLQIQ